MGEGTTRLYRQLERHLGGTTLAAYVSSARSAGMGWRTLAVELTQATGVEVSHEALRSWFDSAPVTDSPATAGAGGRGTGASVPARDGGQGTGPLVPGHTRTEPAS